MTDELKTCDCGGDVNLHTDIPITKYWVLCNDCLRFGGAFDAEAEAIAAWNTRTPTPAPQGAPEKILLEKMEKARGGGEVVKLTKSESRLMLDMAIRAVELDAVFDMQWKAHMRGVERWREETGETLTLPDTADFTVWMLEKIYTSDARVAELEARLKLWEPPTTVETGSLPPTTTQENE